MADAKKSRARVKKLDTKTRRTGRYITAKDIDKLDQLNTRKKRKKK